MKQNKDKPNAFLLFFFLLAVVTEVSATADCREIFGHPQIQWFQALFLGPDEHLWVLYLVINFQLVNEYAVCLLVHEAIWKS